MPASNPGELVELPNGEALFYVDADHSYWRANWKTVKGVEGWHRGTRLTGVTTITKVLDHDPSRLLKWAAQTQCKGVAQLVGDALSGEADLDTLGWLADHESIWAELEAQNLTYDQIRDKAADEGSNVHLFGFQALAMGRPVPDLEEMNEAERGKTRAVMAFWLDHEPEVKLVEQIVYSPRLGVAGRLDFYGSLTRCDDHACGCQIVSVGEPGVLDVKTGKRLFAAAHGQVGGGYPLLLAESGFGKTHWAAFLKVYDDGRYEIIPAHGTQEGFEHSVATYREAGRINREAGKDYRSRQETQQALAGVAA